MSINVIASEAKQSSKPRKERLDCFASLAMTAEGAETTLSKPLAHKPRVLQPIPPRQIDRLGNPDPQPRDDLRLADARMQRERRGIEGQFAVRDRNAQRLAEFAGAGTQRTLVVQATAAAHRGDAMGRLQRADQHGA